MKFTIENEAFAKALGLVKSCILARSAIPILTHVVVEARSDNVVSIRATNMEREAEAECPASVEAEGATTLPGEVLTAIANKLAKGGQMQVAAVDDGRCRIASGSSRYTLSVLPAKDYPARKLPDDAAVRFAIPCADLVGLLQFVMHAVSDERSRIYLCGVHLHVADRKLFAVATDGQRLARRWIDLPKGAAAIPPIIVPPDAVAQILECARRDAEGAAEIATSPRAIELRLPGLRFASQLVDDTYPDYQRVIPQANGHAVSFMPYVLAEAIERVCVVHSGSLDQRLPFVDFAFGGDELHLSYRARGSGADAAETVEAATNGSALAFKTNAKHLADLLKVWPETEPVEVQQSGGQSPILFTMKSHPERLAVIMPVAKGA